MVETLITFPRLGVVIGLAATVSVFTLTINKEQLNFKGKVVVYSGITQVGEPETLHWVFTKQQ